MSDEDYSQSVMIAYPAAWPADYDNAHCTVVYFGEFGDLDFDEAQLTKAFKASGIRSPGRTATGALEMFGEDKDVPVVTLQSMRLNAQHAMLKLALRDHGISWDEKFPEYKPHITVLEVPDEIPLFVELGTPKVYWGGERQ